MNHHYGLHHQTQTHHHASDSDSCSEEDMMRNNVPHSSSNLINPSRKRRRGIIEKRRRDRINTSLCELKRLVPQALEKSGSAKLEKAEILQMTVDHLKTVSANNGYDNTRIARDYHGVGFRECAAEVSRYLVSVEGMDIQDPLRIRLMSHLQMFIAQRSSQAPPPPPPPPTVPVASPTTSANHYPASWGHSYNPPPTAYGYEKTDMFDPFYGPPRTPNTASPPTANYTMTMTATAGVTPTPIGFTASVQANPLMVQYHTPPATSGSQDTSAATSTTSTTPNYVNLTSSKPYRPWGAEMAC